MPAAFAGRHAPLATRGADPRARLESCLSADGPATSVADGPLAVAWTGSVQAEKGGQIICLLDGQVVLDDLASTLGLGPGLPAPTLLATGFARLGDGVLERLGGSYAVLLWDREAGRGLLARDRLGAVPLFVAETEGTLLFASEIRNLLALLPRRPGPDSEAVADWLAGTQSRDARTLYEGVRRVPAAHALNLHKDGWRLYRYWEPRYVRPAPQDVEQAAQALRSGITDAVSRALTGAERPGIMLSGGFDSAAVAASARGLLGDGRLHAYSGVFPSAPSVDESARIARVRNWLGLSGVEAAFHDGSALSGALDFLAAWQVPSASPNVFLWSPLLRRAASDGIDVMLDGEGGDELFGAEVYLLADRLRAGRLLDGLALARRLPGMGDRPQPRWLLRALAKYGLRGLLPYGLHQRLRRRRDRPVPAWLDEQTASLHRARDDPWAWKRGGHVRWWAHLVDVLTVQADLIGAAEQFRRESLLSGVSLRHPLRDPQLIALVLGLAPEPAFDPHLDRALGRRALLGRLPDDILRGDEKPVFNSLLSAALSGRDRESLRALLRDPHPALARHVRQAMVARLLEADPQARRSLTWGTELWRLASLELWLDYQFRPEHLERVRAMLEPEPRVSFTAREPGGDATV